MENVWFTLKKMAKNLILGLIFARQIRAAKIVSPQKIWLRQSLDFMVSHYYIQYQKKLMIQSWESLVTDG